MNEIKFSIYSKSTSHVFFLGGGGKYPRWTVRIKKSDACNVQSDLDLHCTQNVIMLCLAVQGLIQSKLNDVLSDLWWYYD